MTESQLRIKKPYLIIFPALLMLYVFGWAFQLSGLLSQTSSNLLVATIFLFFIIFARTRRINIAEFSLLLSLALLLTLGIINGSDVTGISVYFYYFSCMGLSLYSAKLLGHYPPLDINRVFSIIRIVLAIQIPVLALQTLYADAIAAVSRVPLIPLDVASGTFYLKSDSSLAFTALLAASVAFLLKIRSRQSILLISVAIAFLTNSKASQAAAIAIFLFLNWHELVLSKKLGGVVTFLVGAACSAVLLIAYLYLYKEFGDGVLAELERAYETRFAHETANRFAVIGEALFGEPNLIGRGLLTYHNPIEKSWLYYSGHSLFYSLFIDLGIVGTIVFISGVCVFTIKSIQSTPFVFIFIFVFLIFSFFNFSLSDISFLFSYFFFIYLMKKGNHAGS